MLFSNQLSALSVTANTTNLDCGLTNVTFTFDCAFTGNVIVNNPATGISYPGLSGNPILEPVTNGIIAFDVNVSSLAPTSFNISFVVISSDMGCAVVSDGAAANFSHTCILPPNDNCATAIPLTISTNTCNPQFFTTTNGNVAAVNPSCGGAGYHDLWYSFTANNATVTFEYGNVPGTVGYYGLYASCGGSELACSVMIPATGTFSFDLNNLNVGTTYYLQVMYLPGNSGQDQSLCLHSVTAPSCPTNVVVSTGGSNPPNQAYQATNEISTNGTCNVMGSDVIFTAGQAIELNIGFDSGTIFEAVIGACTP